MLEPGPIALVPPPLFATPAVDRVFTSIVAEFTADARGLDTRFALSGAEVARVADENIDRATRDDFEAAEAELAAQQASDADVQLADVRTTAADFDRELAAVAGELPPEGGTPHYGTPTRTRDGFDPRTEHERREEIRALIQDESERGGPRV